MEEDNKAGFEKAKKNLMERLPFERITKMAKYRSFNMAQYLQLIDKFECMAVLLLESYIFEIKKET